MKWRCLRLMLCGLCMWHTLIYAQNANNTSVDYKNAPSLLWEVTGNGLTKPVYIYGTIHVICEELVYWPPMIDSILLSADKVFFEVDVSKLQNIYYKNDLIARLDTQTYNKSALLNAIKDESYFYCDDGFGYEGIILTKAVNAQIPMGGLETFSSQMFLINMISDDKYGIKKQNLGKVFSPLDMLRFYIKQDIDSLHKMMNFSLSFEQSRKLLDNRNKKWVIKFDNLVKNKTAFIAVGAGHLGGKNGVLNLLREKKYKVSPIAF